MRADRSPTPVTISRYAPALFAGLAACLACATPAFGASTGFGGALELVFEDDGTGIYSGRTAGDRFNGAFSYGDTENQAFDVYPEPPSEIGWEFLGFPVFLTDGTTRTNGGESFVTIQDNFVLDEDEAALASLLLGMEVDPGTLADAWSVSGLSFGAFEEDPTPFDNDDEELVFDGILFEVTYFSLDTSLINGLDYDPTPPGLNEVDGTIFTIIEGDAEGNVIYEALGFVDDTTIIPVPAAAWLFASALGLLGFARRYSCRDSTL